MRLKLGRDNPKIEEALSHLPAMIDRGDPAAVDKAVGNLTTDGAAHDLDLSAIVPAQARFVWLTIQAKDDAADSLLQIRKKGNTNWINCLSARTQVANIQVEASGKVACNPGRVIEYKATNTTWTAINLSVSGWEF